MTVFARPGSAGALMSYESRYDNFIGGEWVAPAKGLYFENPTPVTGQTFCEVARSDEADVDKALDAAHAAAPAWGKTAPAERAAILNKIADRIEANKDALALAEVWDNGKPIRETLAADIPLAADHFRYFAAAIRAQEGSLSQIDEDTVAYHFHEPLGVVGTDHSVELPDPDGRLEAGAGAGRRQHGGAQARRADPGVDPVPDVADRRCDPARAWSTSSAASASRPASRWPPATASPRSSFTGETTTGRLIMQYASQNLIPVTLELGGKSPNIFFSDVMAANDNFQDKALEGFTMFALNQGEVCTCPSRSLIQADIHDEFLELAAIRTKAVRQGDPLDTETMLGSQASNDQLEKILSYIEIGKGEGAKIITGGERAELGGDLSGGYYMQPTIFAGNNKMRDLPGGDLRAGGGGDVVHRLRRRDGHRQRHPLRPGRGRVEPRRQHRLPGRPRHPGRPGVGQLLPRLPAARGVRWLQAIRLRPRNPQDGARPLPADQEPDGVLLRQGARASSDGPAPPGAVITAAAAELLARLQDRHGPVMFHQSGGCCDGSSPMCYPRGDFLVGDRDVLLGVLDVGAEGVPVWISGPQYQAWKHTQLVIDVVPGRGGGFSLEAPEGVRFLSPRPGLHRRRESPARGRAGDHRRRLRARRTPVDPRPRLLTKPCRKRARLGSVTAVRSSA